MYAIVLAVAVVAYAWWVTSLPQFHTGTTVAVVGAGAVAIAWGLRRQTGPREPARADGLVVWALLAGALAAWQLLAYLREPRSEHPTLSSMADGALAASPVRALAFVGWLAVAAALARR
jgi:hypothetical protein